MLLEAALISDDRGSALGGPGGDGSGRGAACGLRGCQRSTQKPSALVQALAMGLCAMMMARFSGTAGLLALLTGL